MRGSQLRRKDLRNRSIAQGEARISAKNRGVDGEEVCSGAAQAAAAEIVDSGLGGVGDLVEGAGRGAAESCGEAGAVGGVLVQVVEDVGEAEGGEDVVVHVGAEFEVGGAFDLWGGG